MYRWREWLYYNFAAGKKLCSRLYSIEVKFYKKNRFWATLWGLRGNVRTPSIARWKARGRLPIRHNWTFFAISYGWDVITGNLSKSACFERGVGHWEEISDGRGRCPPTTVDARKLQRLPSPVYQNIRRALFGFVTTHASDKRTDRQTDKQTDRQNYDS